MPTLFPANTRCSCPLAHTTATLNLNPHPFTATTHPHPPTPKTSPPPLCTHHLPTLVHTQRAPAHAHIHLRAHTHAYTHRPSDLIDYLKQTKLCFPVSRALKQIISHRAHITSKGDANHTVQCWQINNSPALRAAHQSTNRHSGRGKEGTWTNASSSSDAGTLDPPRNLH